jgi:hypothetical protein
MTFKSDLHQICNEIASEFDDWSFTTSGVFKNKTLKHSDLIISPGFTFTSLTPSCSTQPTAKVSNKKVAKLFKQFIGWDRWTVGIAFQMESNDYRFHTSPLHPTNIFPEKFAFKDEHGVQQEWPASWIVQAQAKDYVRGVLTDGIGYLNKYFDFSSEENLLRHLPVGYKDRCKELDYDFYEGINGIAHCLAAIVIGNFDFVERYASNEFKTIVPKNEEDLKKILAALPELRRKFELTGKVI